MILSIPGRIKKIPTVTELAPCYIWKTKSSIKGTLKLSANGNRLWQSRECLDWILAQWWQPHIKAKRTKRLNNVSSSNLRCVLKIDQLFPLSRRDNLKPSNSRACSCGPCNGKRLLFFIFPFGTPLQLKPLLYLRKFSVAIFSLIYKSKKRREEKEQYMM